MNQEKTSNRNLIYWGLALVVVVALTIAIVFGISQLGKNSISGPSDNTTNNISPSISNQATINVTNLETPTSPAQKPLEYNAWIPNWASPSGLSSLKDHKKIFTSISPLWYEVNENGSLKTTFPSNRKEIMEFCKANNIKLYPTIAMFDHELFSKVLQNSENFNRHISSIIEATKLYDGIDLDYESTKLSDKEQYFEMLSQLSKAFNPIGKKLIVTVLAKWGDNILYPSFPETREVQDWQRIGQYSDEIRIMAYDYTFSKSTYPGPIAPLGWVKDILNYALTKLPKEKIVLGIHLYSYEWAISATEHYSFIVDMSANQNSTKAANSYTYETIKNILKNNKGELSEFDNESIFKYEAGGKKKTLVYQSPKQLETRINLAKEFGLKGVVFWRLGGEAELLMGL